MYLHIFEVAIKISVELEDDIKYQQFGMHLLKTNTNEELKLLEQQHATKVSMSQKCVDLLQKWKGINEEPKWEQVIEALRKVDLHNLAKTLETALGHK